MIQKNTMKLDNQHNNGDKQNPGQKEGELEDNPPERHLDQGALSLNRPSDNLEKDGSGQRQGPQDKQTHEEKSLAERRSGNRHQ